MDMTLAQKQALETLVKSGKKVASVAYNPNTVVGDPEAAAVAQGWVEYMRQDRAQLVEVVYTK